MSRTILFFISITLVFPSTLLASTSDLQCGYSMSKKEFEEAVKIQGSGPLAPYASGLVLNKDETKAFTTVEGVVYGIDLLSGDREIVFNGKSAGIKVNSSSLTVASNYSIYFQTINPNSVYELEVRTGKLKLITNTLGEKNYLLRSVDLRALKSKGKIYYIEGEGLLNSSNRNDRLVELDIRSNKQRVLVNFLEGEASHKLMGLHIDRPGNRLYTRIFSRAYSGWHDEYNLVSIDLDNLSQSSFKTSLRIGFDFTTIDNIYFGIFTPRIISDPFQIWGKEMSSGKTKTFKLIYQQEINHFDYLGFNSFETSINGEYLYLLATGYPNSVVMKINLENRCLSSVIW